MKLEVISTELVTKDILVTTYHFTNAIVMAMKEQKQVM